MHIRYMQMHFRYISVWREGRFQFDVRDGFISPRSPIATEMLAGMHVR